MLYLPFYKINSNTSIPRSLLAGTMVILDTFVLGTMQGQENPSASKRTIPEQQRNEGGDFETEETWQHDSSRLCCKL